MTKGSNNTYTLKTPTQEEYIFTSTADASSTKHYLYRLTEIKDKTGNTVTEIVYANDRYFADYILDSAGRKYTVDLYIWRYYSREYYRPIRQNGAV